MQQIRDYELVMVLSPEATEEEVSETVERVGEMVTERGGTVAEHENWGVRRMAYPIRKFDEGNYVLTRFALDASAVGEIDGSLAASEDILRFLVIKL